MRVRRITVAAALAVAVAVSSVATATVASAAKPTPAPATGKPGARPTQPAKPAKPAKVKFSANGTVAGIDETGGTVTVAAKAGTKDVKSRTVTITVPSSTRILLNGSRKTLADLAAGYRITVSGTRVGAVYTAAHIEATMTKRAPAPSPTAPAPAPTDTPPPAPDDSVTPAPTDSATPEPADDTAPTASPGA